MFEETKLAFWPVGTGDCLSVVIERDVVLQVDFHNKVQADELGKKHYSVLDELIKNLPKVNKDNSEKVPYLPAFALTNPSSNHIRGFGELLSRVLIGEIWFTPLIFLNSRTIYVKTQ